MTPSKKPERGCDSMEVTLFNRGWNAAIDATTPPAAPVQPVMTDEKGRPISFWGGKSVEPIKQPAPDTHPLPLNDCWFVNRFDFSQTPPYFRYDTDDRTAKENESELWEIQTQLREQGFELVDYQVEHDCITGYLSKVTQPAPASASWMEMVTANLVREGVNKHKARELAEHFYSLAQRQWVPVTKELLSAQHPWLYESMWIAMKDGSVMTGHYAWMQGRYPDRFLVGDCASLWAFEATHVMPMNQPKHPAKLKEQ